MIPFPDALQFLYADRLDVEMSRPWWRWDASGKFRFATRNDRVELSALYLRELEKYDAERPLPHPGFRSGQVWALAFRNFLVQGTIENHVQVKDFLRLGHCLRAPEPDAVAWLFCGSPLTEAQFYFLFLGRASSQQEVPAPTAFLLADPVCPHRAPWSPSVGSNGY